MSKRRSPIDRPFRSGITPGFAVPDLVIRIKKKTDGSAALSCIRPDATVSWQQQNGLQGRFFPLHDLTHYAVETVLGLHGFFSLVALGWDFGDFGKPWPRGPLPAEAHVVEQVVGFLDTERASGEEWAAADLQLGPPYLFGDDDLRLVRDARRELFARWAALPAGDTLELHFTAVQKPA